MLTQGESKSTTLCILFSMMSMMSTSHIEYKYYEYDIKVSMNTYKYQKL